MELENIKKLYKSIEPDEAWKASEKNFILSSLDTNLSNQYNYSNNVFSGVFRKLLNFRDHPVLTSELIFSALIFVVLFSAYLSLPGDSLYTVKENVIEKISIPQDNKVALVEIKLSDLERAVKENKKQNIEPSIKEVVETVSQINPKEIAKTVKENPQIIEDIKTIRIKTQTLSSIGIDGELEKVENTLKDIVKAQIDDLETRSLSKDQMEILKQAIEHYRNGEYELAMQKILEITN